MDIANVTVTIQIIVTLLAFLLWFKYSEDISFLNRTNEGTRDDYRTELKSKSQKKVQEILNRGQITLQTLLWARLNEDRLVRHRKLVNNYGIDYFQVKPLPVSRKLSGTDVICGIENLSLKTVEENNPNFFRQVNLSRKKFPRKSLLRTEKLWNTCALVGSSSSILNSSLGFFIDIHDYVIRFNEAPTESFEAFVGSKTSLRIMDSEIMTDPRYRFLENRDLYRGYPILIRDPNFYDTIENTPFKYQFLAERESVQLHLLSPKSLWSIWNWLQSTTSYYLLPEPPSSEFLGLILAIRQCKTVRMFGYFSYDLFSSLNKYFDQNQTWHSLNSEKLFALSLSLGNINDTLIKGFLTIPGLSSIKCFKESYE